jgi:hypothetical protein
MVNGYNNYTSIVVNLKEGVEYTIPDSYKDTVEDNSIYHG